MPSANKKARLVRERGDACTGVSRAEVSLPREGVRVSMRMSVSVSPGVRVASKLLILSFLGGLGDWGRCRVLIPQGNAAQSSFVCMYNRGWMGNVCLG